MPALITDLNTKVGGCARAIEDSSRARRAKLGRPGQKMPKHPGTPAVDCAKYL